MSDTNQDRNSYARTARHNGRHRLAEIILTLVVGAGGALGGQAAGLWEVGDDDCIVETDDRDNDRGDDDGDDDGGGDED